jgi:hypothetical protein
MVLVMENSNPDGKEKMSTNYHTSAEFNMSADELEYTDEGVLVLRVYPGGDCWLIQLPYAAGSIPVRQLGPFANALVRRRLDHLFTGGVTGKDFILRHSA